MRWRDEQEVANVWNSRGGGGGREVFLNFVEDRFVFSCAIVFCYIGGEK